MLRLAQQGIARALRAEKRRMNIVFLLAVFHQPFRQHFQLFGLFGVLPLQLRYRVGAAVNEIVHLIRIVSSHGAAKGSIPDFLDSIHNASPPFRYPTNFRALSTKRPFRVRSDKPSTAKRPRPRTDRTLPSGTVLLTASHRQ